MTVESLRRPAPLGTRELAGSAHRHGLPRAWICRALVTFLDFYNVRQIRRDFIGSLRSRLRKRSSLGRSGCRFTRYGLTAAIHRRNRSFYDFSGTVFMEVRYKAVVIVSGLFSIFIFSNFVFINQISKLQFKTCKATINRSKRLAKQ